jgi:hypothetical protein
MDDDFFIKVMDDDIGKDDEIGTINSKINNLMTKEGGISTISLKI